MFSLEARHPDTDCRLVIIDDGRAAAAYLHGPDGDIVGDVWLYNRVPPPSALALDGPPPFLNPLGRAFDSLLPDGPGALSLQWTYDAQVLWADIFVRGALLARVSIGSQPGWNVLTESDGPLSLAFPPEGE